MTVIESMVSSSEQLEWLVRTMLTHYNEWPGPMELRAVFCTAFFPADGIQKDLTHGLYSCVIERRIMEAHETYRHLPPAAAQEARRLLGSADPVASCPCNGFGCIDEGAEFVRCNCSFGKSLPQRILDQFNRAKIKPTVMMPVEAEVQRKAWIEQEFAKLDAGKGSKQ